MSPSKSTTLRVPNELRDEIARIAEQRGTSMVEVVTDAAQRLCRDEWWSSVRHALDDMSPTDVADLLADGQPLDAAAADGLARLVERLGRLDPASSYAVDEVLRHTLRL